MTASLSSYPIVLIDKFCAITFSCPSIAAMHDSTRELTSLALWSTNHVQDQQIVEQTERGHTLSCSMRGFFRTEERTSVMRMRLTGGSLSAEGLDQNRALRIHRVREEGADTIAVEYQALKRLGWPGTHYQVGLRESTDIMVDFYDDLGFLLRTDRFPTRRPQQEKTS